ncbi:hypothetical protein GTP56_17265 [Duganella sp. FT134W]|uniref:DUF3592 domain-containing protein n=1 Tax=Duganella margarita TaxID=2692170 RepID=A0A7X4H409_9BURK|nr:hypothetical protein [Duganella margarita]MYM73937.1 hypothetical protein [Duganella margarita]
MEKLNLYLSLHWKIIAALVFSLIFCLGIFNRFLNHEMIVRNAKFALGTVNNKSCSNHGQIGYSYSVSGKSYYGFGTASMCGFVDCTNVSIGDSVRVTYSGDNIDLSTCASIQSEEDNLKSSIFILTFFVMLAGFGIWRTIKK